MCIVRGGMKKMQERQGWRARLPSLKLLLISCVAVGSCRLPALTCSHPARCRDPAARVKAPRQAPPDVAKTANNKALVAQAAGLSLQHTRR